LGLIQAVTTRKPCLANSTANYDRRSRFNGTVVEKLRMSVDIVAQSRSDGSHWPRT
jgi:hypothetical protein